MNETVSLPSEKEHKILDGAALLFARQGPKRTTIEQIAETAGIGKGTVYLYYSSKDAILAGVARREMSALLSYLRAEVRKGESAGQKLYRFVLAHTTYREEMVKRWNLTQEIKAEMHLEPGMAQVDREYYALREQVLREILDIGQETGEFRRSLRPEMVTVIMGSLVGCHDRWEHSGRELRPVEQAHLLADLILNGLRDEGTSLSFTMEPRH